ncbi:heavy metal translocating P-type ATPase [Streptomyces cocklensis]|uniref:Cation-transporting P-type ATPase J n=1 Tax=Actinacidiphila cocklensis TaxID=887465 RepID=A0A9W4DTF2_9ACTN|nr:heavy metal translocating P-type ATPase [Actinacidiphila cocklensis]MDD1061401.1 heavy metal translocating P-type ATPase [Actinacidiphila cocklensis]CAG6397409.1 putative cation-transporting P-type ATPase J [Actinacidiphila cocklensis]
MSTTETKPPEPRPAPPPAPRRRTRVLALPEARWALAALVLFLAALPLDLAGAPAWTWGPLYAAAYAAGGWEPAWAGLGALRDRTLDVDLLMVVAAIGAAAIGQVLDGALLIVIFATSGALEALATARTADSVRGLLDLAPATATRISDGGAEEAVATDRLAVGDTILVRPGERIGADGRVLDGAGDVDQATITGEPLPVAKGPGDEVFAGTLNGTGALRVKVDRDPADSVIARIVAMVEEASRTKAPTQLFVEKVEQRYSLGMVAATIALFAAPLLFGAALQPTLLRAMTFMIVASPCAVVLATMPPLLSAIANAGRHGVLVKSAVVMERVGQVDAVAFDKTGTLTEGTPRVTDVRPLAGSGLDAAALLRLAAAAEHASEHPLARAVADAARGLDVPPAADFASTPGVGVTATVEGRTVAVANPARLPDAAAGRAAAEVVAGLEDEGRTAVLVLVDGTAAGVLGIADRLREEAAGTVAALTALTGTSPFLATGDNPRAAARLAAEAGIADVRAGLLPQDKAAAVRELAETGRKVLVVGDGVNDAPALAAAHTGIAMGRAGSDLALETADAVVVRDELGTVPTLVSLSRAARRLVVQNLVIAGVFITGLVVWDLAGRLPLPLGVAGHEGSTVIVGLNGLRLLADSAWRRARPA